LLLKILLFSIILFLALELAFRLYNKIFPSYIFSKNDYNRFRGIPNSIDWYNFRLNSRGFADIERSFEKEYGVYRILCIGDSFVWGVVPYKNNFVTLLERKLNENSSRKIEVLNMGINKTGPKDYYELLKNEGMKYNPDMVLCFFFIGNDIGIPEYKHDYSYVFTFLKFIFKFIKIFSGSEQMKHHEYHDDEKTFDDKTYLKIILRRKFIFNKKYPFLRLNVNNSVSHISKMNLLCKNNNIEYHVFLIPSELQINKELQKIFLERISLFNKNNIDLTKRKRKRKRK